MITPIVSARLPARPVSASMRSATSMAASSGCGDARQIAGDLAERPVAEATLVHLGDYVDRGPDSAQVVETCSPFPLRRSAPARASST